jgi:4-amino-4-deoxy-L-arabinose transferase-like glycosyltransferase
MKITRNEGLILGVIVALAMGVKLLLLLKGVIPFNSDEAVVGLMAKHILEGERPIFFYGQAYMGSLDAFLVAAGFWAFGVQVWVIRLVQAVLYALVLVTTYFFAKTIFESVKSALLSVALLAIPTVNVTLYTTASLGGYNEALLIGNLILLCGFLFIKRETQGETDVEPRFWWLLLLAGFWMGCGLWANGLTLIYSLPMGIALLYYIVFKSHRHQLQKLLLLIAGILVGSLPWWLYAIQTGPAQLVRELLGNAVSVEQGSWFGQVASHAINFLLLGLPVTFGFRPPWEVRWLILPLIPLVLAFWLGVLVVLWRREQRPAIETTGMVLLAGVAATLIAGFLVTSFGVDPSGRYFLPLYVIAALFAGKACSTLKIRNAYQYALIGLLVLYQGLGTLDGALHYPPGLTTQFYAATIINHDDDQALIDFLTAHGETRGYTTYWVSYPLAFLSSEQLIFVPELPYHPDLVYTSRDDRYHPYDAMVASSNQVAYISAGNPNLDVKITEGLNALKVTWKVETIGDYQVYYQLSRAVAPEELGLDR